MRNFTFLKICFLALALLFVSCNKGEQKFEADAFEDIDAISDSYLERLSPIVIEFKEAPSDISKIASAAVFSPKQNGSWAVEGEKKVVFTPSEPYEASSDFDLKLDMGFLQGGKKNKKGFTANFTVASAKFDVQVGFCSPQDNSDDLYCLDGVVETDIPVSSDDVASVFKASLDSGGELELKFAKTDKGTAHTFVVSNIKRKKNLQDLMLIFDASSIGFPVKDTIIRSVPSLDSFEIIRVFQEDAQTISVLFSETIDDGQDMRVFLDITSDSSFNYYWDFNGNKLDIISKRGSWPDDTVLKIYSGIKSKKGLVSEKGSTFSVLAKWDIPSVYFVNGGVILPTKGNPIIPIYTKNISGINVEAISIHNKNMLQFLQVNSLDGDDEMFRVGESVWRKSFDFDWEPNMKNKLVLRGLDLSELVGKFPDGMFEIKVTFSKKHSLYQSDIAGRDFSHFPFPDDFFNFSRNGYSQYWGGLDLSYDERSSYWYNDDNPLHPAFFMVSYNRDILKHRNVLISNLALSLKKDITGEALLTAIDLLTSKPVSGVDVELYNYSQRLVKSVKTDGNGMCKIESDLDFSFIQAKRGKDLAWLDLNSPNLSTSNFKVDGVRAKKNIKGFIYGERGVWRPGDKMHLVFILQDIEKTLPENFPVSFTLEDPMGKVIDRQLFTESVDGFYRIDTATNENDVTGTWIARIKAGGNSWTKQLKVETILPNRLAVKIKTQKDYFSQGVNPITLSGEWLHGATASGLKAEISSRFIVNNNPFEDYKAFTFQNNEHQISSSREKIWEGVLSENGVANINLNLNAGKETPGKLKAVFETRIYEPSGAFSVENKVYDFSPFPRYVGMKLPDSDNSYRDMLLTGKEHTVDVVLLTPEGKPDKTEAALEMRIYKLDWRWWWFSDSYDSASYDSSNNAQYIKKLETKAKNGKANFKLFIPDRQWGRYAIVIRDRSGGHSSSQVVYFDSPYWATRGSTDDAGSDSVLLLTAGKEKYNVKEKAEITFPASEGSTALITIEKNGKIIKQDTVTTVKGTNTYSFSTDIDMAPNVYVHVSLIQPFAQTKNSLPVRLYGIVPVMIENKRTRLNPVVKAVNKFEPNSVCKVVLSEESGREATCTIAVVDEGLLGITAFKTKNPWLHFYRKEASRLLSWDIFKYVNRAFGGKLETVLTVGGGDTITRESAKTAERFKPVVFFFGPYKLGKGEKKTIEFTMPEYIGAVRIMAVAGKDGAYGIAEETTKVKSDLMVIPTLPRTLGIDENIQVPVTVFNTSDKNKDVTVKLTSTGAVESTLTQKVKLEKNSDKTVFFKLKTDKRGIAKIAVEASASSFKTAKAKTEVDIISRGTPFAETKTLVIQPGKSIKELFKSKGEEGTKNIAIEVSQIPSLGLEKRLSYLIQYPHGCVEQITSAGFPQLYLPNVMELSKEEVQEIKENVKAVIKKYPSYQLANGGFGYWPGATREDEWANSYVGHFMIEAKKAGYFIDDSIYESWLKRQKKLAKEFSTGSINSQAYRLFTLSLAGKPEIGAMNRLKGSSKLNTSGKAMLAGAYALAGQKGAAKKLITGISQNLPAYRSTGKGWGSSVKDLATVFMVHNILGNQAETGKRLDQLTKISASSKWLSTNETAWILTALTSFYKFDPEKKTEYVINIKGTSSETVKGSLKSVSKVYSFACGQSASESVEIKNTGKNIAFATIRYTCQMPAGTEDSAQKNLRLDRRITVDGRNVKLAELKHGQRFTIILTVTNPTQVYYENLTLALPVPTGWEITNERLTDEGAVESKNNDYDYQDIKDAFIYTYFSLGAGKSKTFKFQGTLTYGGEYYIPAVYAQAMYDDDIVAKQKGEKISAYKVE